MVEGTFSIECKSFILGYEKPMDSKRALYQGATKTRLADCNRPFAIVVFHRDIFPRYDHPDSFDGAPVWEIEDEDDVKVYAAPMSHGIPCLGYVVQERTQPGRLRHEYVKPIVERNLNALKEQGFKIPMKAMAVIKNLPVGSAFTFPDGTVVTQEDAVEPPRKGRKVVICGDSSSCRAIAGTCAYLFLALPRSVYVVPWASLKWLAIPSDIADVRVIACAYICTAAKLTSF